MMRNTWKLCYPSDILGLFRYVNKQMIFNKTCEILSRKGFPRIKIFSSWSDGNLFLFMARFWKSAYCQKKTKQATIF